MHKRIKFQHNQAMFSWIIDYSTSFPSPV